LEQVGDDNERHPEVFASRTINDAEKKYPSTKLEMAAIVFALNRFDVYLLGHKTRVYADHQALVSDYLSFMKGQ